MKKIFFAIAFMLGITSFSMPVQAQKLNSVNVESSTYSVTKTVSTSEGNLNVRKGPGTNYEIIGKFANGTKVQYFGLSDDNAEWCKVSGTSITGKNITGYVNDHFIK